MSKNKQPERVTIMCTMGRFTPRAQQILIPHNGNKRCVWIPISQIHATGDDRVIMTAWIAKQNNLLVGEY